MKLRLASWTRNSFPRSTLMRFRFVTTATEFRISQVHKDGT